MMVKLNYVKSSPGTAVKFGAEGGPEGKKENPPLDAGCIFFLCVCVD